MRTPLKENQTLRLKSTGNQSAGRELVIERLIGMGANVVAYEASDTAGQIHFILKECYPDQGAGRPSDGVINWKDPSVETRAKERFHRAYEMQLQLQRMAATENTNTHLVDTIYEANNTLYTITDHRNAVTYNKVDDKDLQELFITARAIAKAVKAYHDNGYLHLDIKPQNIMVMPESRDMILLLDFDSITRMDALGEKPLSYSPNFAAPEQLQGRTSKICPATDVYAVGATVFYRIFKKLPGVEDQSIFSDWDYSSHPWFEKLSMKVRRLTTEFLRKTLSASVKSRYQTMDECIAALDQLVLESDLDKRFIVDAPPACFNTFVGRQAELEEIHRKLSGSAPVFITGMKGIGKTELAKNYARSYRNEYDVIRFAEYDSSLTELISSGDLVAIENNGDYEITVESFSGLVDERTLLIIDNYYHAPGNGAKDGKIFRKLAGLKCKLLVTTYEKAQDLYDTAEWVELEELGQEEQLRLFEKEYGAPLSGIETEQARHILRAVRGYTLLIPLIAKMLGNSSRSFDDVERMISETGAASLTGAVQHWKDDVPYVNETVWSIIRSVLDLSNLSTEEHSVLNCLSMLKGYKVRREKLIEWLGYDYDNAISSLIFKRWVNADGTGRNAFLSLHDVVCEVVAQEKKRNKDLSWVKKVINNYLIVVPDRLYMGDEIGLHPHSYPPVLHHISMIRYPFSGLEYVQTGKKFRLISTILHAIDVERSPVTLIESLLAIVDWDLNRAYNYAPDCDEQLEKIEASEAYDALSVSDRFNLHALRLFFNLTALCDCEEPREESIVLSCCEEAITQAKKSITILEESGDREDQYLGTTLIYREALLTAGVNFGVFLFSTSKTDYSSKALESYVAFVNRLAQKIKDTYAESIADDPRYHYSPFENSLNYFNHCMKPCSYREAWDNYFYSQHLQTQAELNYDDFEDIDEGSTTPISPEEAELLTLSNRLYDEARELIRQCQKMGYVAVDKPAEHPEINLAHLTDPRVILGAEEKLETAREKCERAVSILQDNVFPAFVWPDWLSVSVILSCCKGDYAAAKDYYSELLGARRYRLYFGNYEPNLRLYNTLKHLGFTDFYPVILEMNIQHLDRITQADYEKNHSTDDPWEQPNYGYMLGAQCEILEYADMLGNKQLLKNYIIGAEKYFAFEGNDLKLHAEMLWGPTRTFLAYAEELGDEELISRFRTLKYQLEDTGFEAKT